MNDDEKKKLFLKEDDKAFDTLGIKLSEGAGVQTALFEFMHGHTQRLKKLLGLGILKYCDLAAYNFTSIRGIMVCDANHFLGADKQFLTVSKKELLFLATA